MYRRITLVCSVIKYGGVGKILSFVADTLLSEGWSIEVLSLQNEERPDFLPEGASFISIPKVMSNNKLFWRIKKLRLIRTELKRISTKTICTFGSEPSVMVRLATLGMKDVTVVSAERSDPYTLPKFWRIMSSWAYSNSDYCVFQLEKQRDFYGEKVRKKSYVIPNAFIPKGEVKETRERRKVIVSAGRFVYQKGYDTLIRAFAIVNRTHPDYMLELYGGGDEQPLYERIIEENNLKGNVKLFGYVNNISEIISGSSVFVLSSRFEGIPNVLIEAMSAGVPTVATDCTPGGPAFLTDNGKRGLLVPVDDVKAMAKAINRIIEDSELSKQLSTSGREICVILDKDKIARQWVDMFNKIVN